jgi:hypothetical protein
MLISFAVLNGANLSLQAQVAIPPISIAHNYLFLL